MTDPALQTLSELYEHDDFMESLGTVADMGAGNGAHSLWWATRHTREDEPRPLNLKVHAVDRQWEGIRRETHPNINWISRDWRDTQLKENSVDLVWCSNSFQATPDPIGTLTHWHRIMREDAMLCLIVPYCHNLRYYRDQTRIDNVVLPGAYINYNMSNILLMLASCGFDCRGGHFKFQQDDPWIYAIAYKTTTMPKICNSWFELLADNLLPVSAASAIEASGHLRDSDLILEWIDHSVYSLNAQ
jgi:SAM-dependent methyltransferase